ncbi:MAG: prephenate dehydrogenase [Candidatus Hydrothermarchaeales archaeon]
MKIAVIGGSGEFGRLFAAQFKEDGHEVTITGRDVHKGEKVAQELGVAFTTDNVAAAKASDVVMISVYIENTLEVIEEVAPHVRTGCLLMDVTSVKEEPCAAMEKFAGKDVEIMGTHPMFGPRVTSMEGLTFILTPVRVKKWKGFVMDFLEKQGAKVFSTTPEEHDRMMSVVQGLTHFAYISAASTLRELNVDVGKTRNFASPVYELMLDLIARIVGQSPQLYASIQMHNPRVKEVHEVFIDEARKLSSIVKEKDVGSFTKLMANAARHLGDIDASMGRSDKAIRALTSELKRLRESVGKEVALKHIYSGAVHIGVVKDVAPDEVSIENKSGKKVTLKLSNVELLSWQELRRWKSENLSMDKRDFSVLFPGEVDEETVRVVVKNMDHKIVSCSVLDTYAGKQIPEGKKSITIRVEAVDFDLAKVEDLLKGLGGVIR